MYCMISNLLMRCLFLLVITCPGYIFSQVGVFNLQQINKMMDDLVKDHPRLVSKIKIGQSFAGHPIHALKIGEGEEQFKPGIAIVAGIEGNHFAGSWIALSLARKVVNSSDTSWINFRKNNFLYVIPYLNADVYATIDQSPLYEQKTNHRPTNNDKDLRIDEDPFDDINLDGVISMVRVEDVNGNMVADSLYSFLMVPWDKKDSKKKRYILISEGTDQDKDGKFNEDGIGGVNLNNNFSFNYPAFGGESGDHAMSESETRALADFLYDRYNLYAVFTFGLENTLSEPIKHDKTKNSKRIIQSPLEKDGLVNELVSEWYKNTKVIQDPVEMKSPSGSFSQWAYFHYGRFSFSTPGWLAPLYKAQDTSADSAKMDTNKLKKEGPKMTYEQRYVKWADSVGIKDYFIPWKEINHPDFPGLKAEVGGFRPYALYNPPTEYLDDCINQHLDFLTTFVEAMPKLRFHQVKIDSLGSDVFRISGKVINVGKLPSHTELGDKTRWVRKIRNRIVLSKDQELLINVNRNFHNAVFPGESIDFQWLVKGKGSVVLEAGSPMTGLTTMTLTLK